MLTQRKTIEATTLVAITAVLYWLGFELQSWMFQFTEYVPGVHWFYFPAGLRVLFVLVAGIYGAVGICVATFWIDLLYARHSNVEMLLLTAVASGFGAWSALWLLRWRGVIAEGLQGLTGAALMQFALIYALLNALIHQISWWAFQREGSLLMVDIWPMLVGDLLGSMAFLYFCKLIFRGLNDLD